MAIGSYCEGVKVLRVMSGPGDRLYYSGPILEDDPRILSIEGDFRRPGDEARAHMRDGSIVKVMWDPWCGGVERDKDPHGLDQHAPGAKLDADKPRVGLVLEGFANAILEVAKVGTYGAKKYTDNGWMEVANGEARYKDAMLRHLLQSSHEELDQETNLLHLASCCWNALAVLELHVRG